MLRQSQNDFNSCVLEGGEFKFYMEIKKTITRSLETVEVRETYRSDTVEGDSVSGALAEVYLHAQNLYTESLSIVW
jgi:hypothetical protein